MSHTTMHEFETAEANVVLGKTGDKGHGVIARGPIAAGDRIFAVSGRRTRTRTRYTVQVSRTEHIEPVGPAKFLNHSCAPNAGVRTRADGGLDVVAIVPIAAGAEVTVDYAMFEEVVGPSSEGPCLCETTACRGRITGYRDTTPAWRLRFGRWTAAHLAA